MLRRQTMAKTMTPRQDWRTALLCRLLVVAILIPPQTETALAQSYQEGMRKYTRGDIKGAEAALNLALPRTRSAAEKAKVYKLLGIAQYMQNKRPQAAQSFQQALALNPATRISKDEVLDESVVPFFDAQRRATPQRAPVQQAQRPAPRPAAPAQPPAVASTGQKKRTEANPRFGKPVNRTSIIIDSNAKNAQVFLDDILAGNVNNRIEAQPGTANVTLKAPGFKAKKFRVNIRPNRENRYDLELAKATPKKAPARALAKKDNGRKRAGGADPDLFAEEGGDGANELAGRDLMNEFEAETQAQGTPRAARQPARASRRPTAAPNAPIPQQAGAAVAVAEPPAPPAMAPVAPAPNGSPTTPPPAPPNYSAPTYQAPPGYYPPQGQPGQPGQPGYPPQAPPYYQQPPAPGMAQQPQQAYPGQPMAQPGQPPVAPPPAEYYAQEQAAPTPPPVPQPPPPAATSSPRRNKRLRPSSDTGPNRFVLFLPLGIGQFANSETFLGIALAGGQIGSLYFYFASLKTADKAVANAQAVVGSNDYTDDEKDQFVRDTEKFVRAQKANAQLGLLGFVALYGAGVIEANLSASSSKPARNRRAALDPDGNDQLSDQTLGGVFVSEAVKEDPGAVLRMGLIPNESSPGLVGIGLGLDWHF